MNEISLMDYAFEGHTIRIWDADGNPWFVAKDVCDVLAHTNSRIALEMLDVDERADVSIPYISPDGVIQKRSVNIINESGLWALITRSRKPEAKRLRKWVTSEVLPQIRRTGRYIPKGIIPPEAQKPQIAGGENIGMIGAGAGDFENALWLYAIGAIGKADVYRFKFGAAREPSEWELSFDPLRLFWVNKVIAARRLLDVPTGDYPLALDTLEKIVVGNNQHRFMKHCSYAVYGADKKDLLNRKEFDFSQSQTMLEKYFEDYGGDEEKSRFYQFKPVEDMYISLRSESEYIKIPEFEPVYIWHSKTIEEFSEIRNMYAIGAYDAARVRTLLFGDQLIGRQQISAPRSDAPALPGIKYEQALERIKAAFDEVNQITAYGLARASGISLENIEAIKEKTVSIIAGCAGYFRYSVYRKHKAGGKDSMMSAIKHGGSAQPVFIAGIRYKSLFQAADITGISQTWLSMMLASTAGAPAIIKKQFVVSGEWVDRECNDFYGVKK
jgi:prophage antirepressor-like protein